MKAVHSQQRWYCCVKWENVRENIGQLSQDVAGYQLGLLDMQQQRSSCTRSECNQAFASSRTIPQASIPSFDLVHPRPAGFPSGGSLRQSGLIITRQSPTHSFSHEAYRHHSNRRRKIHHLPPMKGNDIFP